MKDFVEYVARALVDNPDDVEVTEDDTRDGQQFELRVNEDDRGKIIGKKGRTAHAMRVLLAAAAGPDESTSLEIVD